MQLLVPEARDDMRNKEDARLGWHTLMCNRSEEDGHLGMLLLCARATLQSRLKVFQMSLKTK
eukprot:6492773-Amphidinium_carterae.1